MKQLLSELSKTEGAASPPAVKSLGNRIFMSIIDIERAIVEEQNEAEPLPFDRLDEPAKNPPPPSPNRPDIIAQYRASPQPLEVDTGSKGGEFPRHLFFALLFLIAGGGMMILLILGKSGAF